AREFSDRASEVEWRSGRRGEHTLAVIVESPWGTRKTAEVRIAVRYGEYYSPETSRLERPDTLPEPRAGELPFGVADVRVEKSEVCQGEPSRIRVTPFDRRGEDRWLTPVVNGQQSWEAPFLLPLGTPGPRLVPVAIFDSRLHGGGEVESASTFVFIRVKDCVAPFPLFVEHRA